MVLGMAGSASAEDISIAVKGCQTRWKGLVLACGMLDNGNARRTITESKNSSQIKLLTNCATLPQWRPDCSLYMARPYAFKSMPV